MCLGSSFHSCSAPWIEQRVSLLPFGLVISCSWSIHLKVQLCSSLYQWFLGVCEMFQTSWGGGPSGSPPHARMHTYYATDLDAVLKSWWVQFLSIIVFIACTYPPDDPFSFHNPSLFGMSSPVVLPSLPHIFWGKGICISCTQILLYSVLAHVFTRCIMNMGHIVLFSSSVMSTCTSLLSFIFLGKPLFLY